MEGVTITGITYNRDEARVTVEGLPDTPGTASDLFSPIAAAGVNVDMIIQNAGRNQRTDMTFTVPKGDLDKTMAAIDSIRDTLGASGISNDPDVVKISVIGVGMRSHTGVASRLFQTMAAEGINIQMVSTSEIKISCLIQTKYLELAIRALHTTFGLDTEACDEADGCLPNGMPRTLK